MPRKRKSNLSQSTNAARAKKVARRKVKFRLAELRRLEQAEREAAHRAAETPEQSQARRQQNTQHLASQRVDETPKQSQDRLRQHAEYLAYQRAAEFKVGVPVLLMRNLDALRLCNDTRLRITELGKHIVNATILAGEAKGDNFSYTTHPNPTQ
ncbi:hypothetical protein TNCV_1109411 [Trichonephila clavipes]|nr:hypothetical protein TNCV_1109411 [Trichonephila clavipes]